MSIKDHIAPYVKPQESDDRKRALKHIGVGAAITGGAAAAEFGLDRRLKRHGVKGPVVSAVKGKFKPKAHVPHLAGRMGTRAVSAAGVPVMAYGLWNIANPKGKVDELNIGRDVIRPAIDHATMRDQREKLSEMRKSLNQAEQEKLVQRKHRGTKISHAAGALGVAALVARAPQGAKALVQRAPKAGKLKALKRLASHEPTATAASNTLGVASIGTGALGSFNYAAQQKLEAKNVEKALPSEGVMRNIGRVRVLGQHSKDRFMVLDNRDTRRLVHRGQLVFVKPKGAAKPVKVNKPSIAGEQMELFKADKFLAEYGDRISPKAEEGYKHLKEGRNARRTRAAGNAGIAGLSGVMAYSAARGRRLGWTAAHAGLAGLATANAAQNLREAGRWDARMGKIKTKAKERAAAGEYGQGRLVEKAEKKQKNDHRGALAAGAAVGAGAALMTPFPVKLPNDQGASDRIARQLGNRDSGQVRTKDVRGVATGTGERFAADKYQDRLSAGMDERRRAGQPAQDPRRPVKIKRTPDGKMRITDGHHRVQSMLDLGEDKVHVKVENTTRGHRAFVPLWRQAKYQRDVMAARQANGPRPLSDIHANASAPIPKAARVGNKVRSRGERVALQTRKPRNAGLLATGAAAVGGAAVYRHYTKPVEKALVPRLAPKVPRLGGGFLKPTVRRSYVGTSSTGKKFTVRGTVR